MASSPKPKVARSKARAKRAEKPAGLDQPDPLTREQAAALMKRMLKGAPWTDAQKRAIREYSLDGASWANFLLRGVTSHPDGTPVVDDDLPATRKLIRVLRGALRPLPEPVRVFRNGYSERLTGIPRSAPLQERMEALRGLVGKRRQDAGFFSASIRPLTLDEFAYGDVRIDVTLPAGMRAAFAREHSVSQDEDEVIVDPGLNIEFYEFDESGDIPTLRGRAAL